jgi:hypothetical protein
MRLARALIAVTVLTSGLGVSGAFAATFGADLNQPANNTITCDQGWPNQLYAGGAISPFEQPFYNAGSGSCMWTGSGVAQTLQAPATGIVTSVRVKVGAITGPMQIVVLRTLYQNTDTAGHPNLACCIVQDYGPVFTPAADEITTVPTELNMDEQTTPPEGDPEIVHFDLLALEVLAPGVPVPAYTATNGGSEANIPDFAWFPAPSQVGVQAPSTNVLSFTGDFSGYQLLMNAELGGAGANAPPQNPVPNPLPPALQTVLPALAFPKLTLPVRNGKVVLPLKCIGAKCVGYVLLQNLEQHGAKIARAKPRARPKILTYGSGNVDVAAGSKGSVTIKLSTSGKKATRARRSIRVWANFTFGATKLSKRITLHG